MSEVDGSEVADLVRVVAQKPNTIVTFDGAPGTCNLQPGEYCDRFVQDHVRVTANEPILVAHYTSGAGGIGEDTGDPSMSYAVPTEQYRTEYAVLVPDKYNSNYFSLVTPASGTVAVDGVDVTSALSPFGSGAFDAGRVPMTPGPHTITCPDGCGVEIYGWSDAVSYLFAGGLDLELIAVP